MRPRSSHCRSHAGAADVRVNFQPPPTRTNDHQASQGVPSPSRRQSLMDLAASIMTPRGFKATSAQISFMPPSPPIYHVASDAGDAAASAARDHEPSAVDKLEKELPRDLWSRHPPEGGLSPSAAPPAGAAASAQSSPAAPPAQRARPSGPSATAALRRSAEAAAPNAPSTHPPTSAHDECGTGTTTLPDPSPAPPAAAALVQAVADATPTLPAAAAAQMAIADGHFPAPLAPVAAPPLELGRGGAGDADLLCETAMPPAEAVPPPDDEPEPPSAAAAAASARPATADAEVPRPAVAAASGASSVLRARLQKLRSAQRTTKTAASGAGWGGPSAA